MKLDTMSSDKKADDTPPVQFVDLATTSTDTAAKKLSRLTKKHVLIAVVTLLAIGLVMTCVLVAVRMITDSNKEIVKYQVTYQDSDKSNVTETAAIGDGDNTVIYHFKKSDALITIINDFNRNIQVSKVVTSGGAMCYVAPLNRSMVYEPNTVDTVDTYPGTNATFSETAEHTKVSPDPISDISFLGNRVVDTCNNIPTHWEQPSCDTDGSPVSRQRGIKVCIEVEVCIGLPFCKTWCPRKWWQLPRCCEFKRKCWIKIDADTCR